MNVTKKFSKDFVGAKGTCHTCGCQVVLDEKDFQSINWNLSQNNDEYGRSGYWTVGCPSCPRSIKCRK